MGNSQTFGKFHLVGKLATGGMAEVFLAKVDGPAGFQKTLVLKRILPHLAEDERFVEMFLNEARLAARLNHPNIVTIFELGEEEDSYFIAMEYIDGPNLRTLGRSAARSGRPIPVEHAAKIISLACEGLGFAHDFADDSGQPLNLIHRDVSPDNILLSRAGGVKVVDFGIVKAANQSHLTQTGTIKGKLSYMAPEQARGMPLDRRADIFSLGVVLYELIAGMKPFDSTSEVAALQAILFAPPAPLLEKRPDCPPALSAIIERALQKDREDRYSDCRAMQLDLERFLMECGTPIGAYDLSKLVAELSPSGPPALRTAPPGPAIPPQRDAAAAASPLPPQDASPDSELEEPTELRQEQESPPPVAPRACSIAAEATRLKSKPADPPSLARQVLEHAEQRPASASRRSNKPVLIGVSLGLALAVAAAGYALFGDELSTDAMRLAPSLEPTPIAEQKADTPSALAIEPPATPPDTGRAAAAEPEPTEGAPPGTGSTAAAAPEPVEEAPPGTGSTAAAKPEPAEEAPPTVAKSPKPDATKPTSGRPGRGSRGTKTASSLPTNPAPVRGQPLRSEPVVAQGRLSEKDSPPVAVQSATLVVRTDPPCLVSVDGTNHGTTPVRLAELSPGPHALVVHNAAENLERKLTVTLAPGESRTETITFGTAKLVFRVRPWARVEIDGRARGVTPLPDGITVYEGEHRVRLYNPDLKKEVIRTVWIRAGEDLPIKADLER